MPLDVANLSFVTTREEACRTIVVESWWNPERAGDYGADCATGRVYADQLVDLIRETGDVTLLQRTVAAMPRGSEGGGVEIGFLATVAAAAVGGRR